ncbi:MAG: energy transducer TonB, partial [Paracraurococcus sp.]
ATPAPAAPASPAAPAASPVLAGAARFRRPPAPPHYPEQARDAGIEGTALLRLRIAADGTTREIRLLRSSGNRELDAAAEAAARRWEIAPALENGRPIEAWVDVPVRFRIDD